MQLRRFTITGLFDVLTHNVAFPVPDDESTTPALVVLHGRNGVGKTTVLRMMDGMLRLDFNPFREVPFERSELEFDSGHVLAVAKGESSHGSYLEVTYRDHKVRLHTEHSGPMDEKDSPKVEEFRRAFLEDSSDVTLEFIDTERLNTLKAQRADLERADLEENRSFVELQQQLRVRRRLNPKAKAVGPPQQLADRVRQFIQEAQVNYRTFFSTTEPDLFPRIIERLTSDKAPDYDIAALRLSLQKIHEQDLETGRFGLESDRWDFDQMMAQLDDLTHKKGSRRTQALTVLGSYVEVLESRAAERALVADRLLTFERLMNSFFTDKHVSIAARSGIRIESSSRAELQEHQLSSGEYHLLFLMVAALATRRRGTVIAIDEPEMSMHVAWQRRLIPALLECASNAEPLFIFATHSPDMAASYPDAMVELS